jgi:multiple sugar transport system substrate-binding protein
MKFYRFLLMLTLLVSGACSVLPLRVETNQPALPTTSPSPTPTRTRQPEINAPPGPVILRVWLPSEFDPGSGTPAGTLMQARLQEFAANRPQVRLDVRIKTLQDQGGLLDALSSANAAAPLALPDLVALPRPLMEAAALKGLVQPLDGLTTIMSRPEWYEYARQLALLQDTTFGIPFAGDALVMLYRPEQVETPPAALLESLQIEGPLIFAAADPQALFTLNLYRAAGGRLLDEQGRPTLDSNILESVLSFFDEAERADFLPLWLTQLETDQQAWDVFQSGRSSMVVTWTSRYFRSASQEINAAPLPTLDGSRYTLATGWLWSIASPSPEKQSLAIELAEFLSDAEFLSAWNLAAGYVPPRSDSLAQWTDGPPRALANRIVLNMNLIPSSDILSTLAPSLQQVTIQILKQQAEPAVLAEEAVSRLDNP